MADRAGGAQSELVTWAEAAHGGARLRRCRRRAVTWPATAACRQPPDAASRSRTADALPSCSGSGAGTPAARRPCARAAPAHRGEAQRLFRETDFSFLFVPTRKLFSIGFRVRDGSLDPNCYDLLASEARLTSFLAIAKGDVDASHWFRLGRPLTRSAVAPRSSPGRAPCSST